MSLNRGDNQIQKCHHFDIKANIVVLNHRSMEYYLIRMFDNRANILTAVSDYVDYLNVNIPIRPYDVLLYPRDLPINLRTP